MATWQTFFISFTELCYIPDFDLRKQSLLYSNHISDAPGFLIVSIGIHYICCVHAGRVYTRTHLACLRSKITITAIREDTYFQGILFIQPLIDNAIYMCVQTAIHITFTLPTSNGNQMSKPNMPAITNAQPYQPNKFHIGHILQQYDLFKQLSHTVLYELLNIICGCNSPRPMQICNRSVRRCALCDCNSIPPDDGNWQWSLWLFVFSAQIYLLVAPNVRLR